MNLESLWKGARALVYRATPPRRYECVLCQKAFSAFLPYRGGYPSSPPLMRAVATVGSDLDHFECPWCGCHDRERHLFLYMDAEGLLSGLKDKAVLHFAPEKRLAKRIDAAQPLKYLKCDLFPVTPDVLRVDLLGMPFDNSSFDLLIANHVMEHVADDARALAEIVRVLKPGGYAILQTPFASALHRTWSDPGITSEAARLHAYGQEDHVRLYGKDIFERFGSSGLISRVRAHQDLLPDVDARKFGVNEAEPFFLFQRPEP